jgi:hypothetical protein
MSVNIDGHEYLRELGLVDQAGRRLVMPGLDPGIHEAAPRAEPYGAHSLHVIMDCRVEPGNDAEGTVVAG